jgi:KaiC/GvpD/RAD55 family RecA-like ATPase
MPQTEASVAIATCQKDGLPAYRSVHVFGADFKHHVETHGSVKGWSGESYAPYLCFDIDDDLDVATRTAQQFVGELVEGFKTPPEHIIVWFSGKKGYHLQLPAGLFGGWTASKTLHKKLKILATRVANGYDIDTAIYDQKRLLRCGGTKHDVSGRYKTHIPTDEFLSMPSEAVRDLGLSPPDLTKILPPTSAPPVPALESVWLDVQTRSQHETKKQSARNIDYQSFEGSFPLDLSEGDGRDNRMYFKARQLREWGVPAWESYNILKLWDSQCKIPLTQTNGESILMDKIRSAYGTDAALDADEGIQVHSGLEALNEYQNYLDDPGASIATGFDELDRMHRNIRTGEVAIILGKTGSGKTAWALNALRNMAEKGHRVLFFSLEMTLARVVERQIAIELGMTADEVEADYGNLRKKAHSIPWMEQYHICSQSAMTMPQIEETIQKVSEVHGKVDCVCIDYLGLIRSTNQSSSVSSYQAVSEIASQLKNVAKRCNIAVMVLSQVSRGHGEQGNVQFSMNAGRDSGVIEEGADLVIGIHRPELGSLDRTMAIQVLKSRKGRIHTAGNQLLYPWHGPSFRVQSRELNSFNLPDDETFITHSLRNIEDPLINQIAMSFDGEDA